MKDKLGFSTDCLITRETQNSDIKQGMYPAFKVAKSEEDFKKQIEKRFKGKFKEAWEEAVKICKSYDKGVLLSQRYFYEAIYKPRRDELANKWSELISLK
jgi:5-formaminoimidazole-4-carboxamide-1-beta-D-ribofuranosyl 5'-monophosphate synthetase